MASIDHIIVKVNDLKASVVFYTEVLGLQNEGTDLTYALPAKNQRHDAVGQPLFQ
jgi:catechol 2,3-dioxygenase-like lactoylglutathione lyase family enzyme